MERLAGHRRRRRRSIVERRDVDPVPALAPRDRCGVVGTGMDLLAMPPRAEARVKVDPAEPLPVAAMAPQYVAQHRVAPHGCIPGIEQAVREFALAAADRRLQLCGAVAGDVRGKAGCILGAWRPRIGHDHRVHARIGGVRRAPLAKIAEVPIDVDVVLVGAAQMRKPVWIDRVMEESRRAAALDRAAHRLIVQQCDLATGPAEPFDAVHAGGEHSRAPARASP